MTAELMWTKFFWFVRAANFNYWIKFLCFEQKASLKLSFSGQIDADF